MGQVVVIAGAAIRRAAGPSWTPAARRCAGGAALRCRPTSVRPARRGDLRLRGHSQLEGRLGISSTQAVDVLKVQHGAPRRLCTSLGCYLRAGRASPSSWRSKRRKPTLSCKKGIFGMRSTERDPPTPTPTQHLSGYGDDKPRVNVGGLGSQDVPEAARRGPARVSQATGRPRPPSLAPWPGACGLRGSWRTVDAVAAQGQGIAAFQASAPAGGESPTSPTGAPSAADCVRPLRLASARGHMPSNTRQVCQPWRAGRRHIGRRHAGVCHRPGRPSSC